MIPDKFHDIKNAGNRPYLGSKNLGITKIIRIFDYI